MTLSASLLLAATTAQSGEEWRQFLLIPGLAMMLFALFDLMATSLQMGEGPLSRFVYRSGHIFLYHLYKLFNNRKLLTWTAAWLVIGTFGAWFFFTWVGWSLLFWSQPAQVVWASEDQSATLLDTAYFIGYTLTTLGLGDLHATTQFWRVMTSLAALNGFFLLTFSLTFLAPLATAHGERRKLALRIFRAGSTPYKFVLTGLKDHSDGLSGLLHDLSDDIIKLDAKHKSSPYLHSFHDRTAAVDLHLQLPVLGEALLLMQYGLKDGPPKGLCAVRDSVDSLLESYQCMQVYPNKGMVTPPPLSLQPLRDAGIATVSDEEFAAALAEEKHFRTKLYQMVHQAGWSLDKVFHPDQENEEH